MLPQSYSNYKTGTAATIVAHAEGTLDPQKSLVISE
jgi:hypothetical protein